MAKFQSTQEQILHQISVACLGLSCVFSPNNVTNNREPCDIAWVSGKTIVLLYCTDSNKDRIRQDNHNLKQAAGWMRRWSDEITISGEDGDQAWNFKRSEIDRVFIISVCDSQKSDQLYKIEESIVGTTAVVSLTSRFMLHFLQYYPNTFDFIDFVLHLDKIGEISERNATSIFEDLFRAMFQIGINSVDSKIEFQDGPMFDVAFDTIKMLKEEMHLKDIPPIDLSLADISWMSGAIFASHNHIDRVFKETGHLSFGWAKNCIRGRNISILVTASFLESGNITKEFFSNENSDNYLFLCKFGFLPNLADTWMHMLGHSLKPDSRGEDQVR